MENKIIEVSGLTKKYASSNSFALDHIDLTIKSGSILGYWVQMELVKYIHKYSFRLTNKSSGKVKVCGIDLDENPKTVRGNIGVVPQEINIDPFFSPIQIMDIQAGLYGVKKNNNKNLEILKNLNLLEKATAYSRSLSGGMKRRLMVAKAMVHNPPLLILDEPTAGVDVELRSKLWDSIRSLNKRSNNNFNNPLS